MGRGLQGATVLCASCVSAVSSSVCVLGGPQGEVVPEELHDQSAVLEHVSHMHSHMLCDTYVYIYVYQIYV